MKLKILFPFVFLLLMFFFDLLANRYLGDQTFAPFLAVFSFFIMAGFLSPRWILTWLPLFAAMSYWLILDSSQFPKTRIVTVVLAGLLASLAAFFREKADRQSRELDMILRNLPTPWALISVQGAILRTNPLGADLLGSSAEEIVGQSIFDLSGNIEARQLLINDFVKINKDSNAESGIDFPLGRIKANGKNLGSRIFPIPSWDGKPLLLVLRET